MIIDETYSAFVKEAGKTGGGPPPAVPPELPGDIVDGPPVVDRDPPSTWPGAPGPELPLGPPGPSCPRASSWPMVTGHSTNIEFDPTVFNTGNHLTLQPPNISKEMHN